MAGFFSEDFIQEVIDRNSIEDIVSEYITLKRAGSSLKGLCPFHNEKTPSFCVDPNKQFYHCFGCGVGGTVINFVMQIQNLDFVEAIKLLADKAGLDLPSNSDYTGGSSHLVREKLYEINKAAAYFYHKCLFEDEGKEALEYINKRRLLPETVRHFALGYAPKGNRLITHLKELGFDDDTMLSAGLTAATDSGRIYERFVNRLIFPIVDRRKNVIGFGGRVLDDSKPKYLNSAETPVFSKSKNLFALNFANRTKQDYFLLVEGYMDVIALHQSGITSAVATLGTALTEDQARLIKRCKSSVVIAYDSDEAGQKATKRAIEILAAQGLEVRVLSQSEAKDPDDYIKKFGAGAFKKLIDDSPVQIEYKILQLKNKYDLGDTKGKIEYIKELAVELAKFDSEVEREIYAKKTAEETGVSQSAVMSEIQAVLEKTKRKRTSGRTYQKPDKIIAVKESDPEKTLMIIMLNYPEVIRNVTECLDAEEFSEGAFREIAKALFDGKDPKAIIADTVYANELADMMFNDTKYDNIEETVSELVTSILVRNNKRKQLDALEKNDIVRLNQLINEGRRLVSDGR